MTTISAEPAALNLAVTAGDDFTLTLTVTENGSAYVWTGATIVTSVVAVDGATVATPTTTTPVSGTLTWSLSDTQTAAASGKDCAWYLTVTKSGLSRTWLAGFFEANTATHPGGATSAAATLSITTTTATVALTTAGSSDSSLSVYNIRAAPYLAVGDGTTDDTAAILACITDCQSTGGIMWCPHGTYRIDGQLPIPNDGASFPAQKPMRWIGAGAHFSGKTTATTPAGGTIFDMRYSGGPCVLTKGSGTLEIEGITFTQRGTAHTQPFLQTTNTTLLVHDCSFVGHSTKTTTACDQDAIILGGTTTNLDGSDTAAFQGYGSVISDNYFNRIRRGVYGRVYCNGVVIRSNTWWAQCGGTAAIELNSGNGVDYCVGNVIADNLIECVGYTTAISLTTTLANSIIGNNLFDAGAIATAYVTLGANCTQNSFVAGYYTNSKPLLSDYTQANFVFDPNPASPNPHLTRPGGLRIGDTVTINGSAISSNDMLSIRASNASSVLIEGQAAALATGDFLSFRNSAGTSVVRVAAGPSLIITQTGASPSTNAITHQASDGTTVAAKTYISDIITIAQAGGPGTGDAQNRVQGQTCGYYLDRKDGTQEWLIYRTAAGASPLYIRDIVNARMLATINAGASSTASRVDWLAIQRYNDAVLWQTTVGAAGAASALPATPTKYLKVQDNSGTTYVIPAYAAS